jgi:lipid-A-disaccharide synthase
MRYYIIAGERSGDLHGGNLIRAIKTHDPEATFRAFGGDFMQDAGAEIAVHYDRLAFMGFIEVVKNFRTIASYIRKCKQDISNYQPDVLILIDYAGFNQRIAKFASKKQIRVFYYITPKVWAWYQRRALQLKATVERMFVILPFEKDFFKRYNCEVDYVGNPVLDAVKKHMPNERFLLENKIATDKPLIAMLPGSRKQELKSMVPILASVAERFSNYQFAVAAIKTLDQDLYKSISHLPNVSMIYEDTYNLLLNAKAAIVTSGTATLETALFKVPQTVIYKASRTTYWIVKILIQVKFISLVNLIAGKEVIKELIQDKANAEHIGRELQSLVEDKDYRDKILTDYNEIYKTLDIGSASENAARLMVQYLKEKKPKQL